MKWKNNRDFLLTVPIPDSTDTYKAVPHKIFFEDLRDRISNSFKIKEERYLSNRDGTQMNVKYIIDDESNPLFYRTITAVNSYNKSLACRIITGSTCSKGIHTYMFDDFSLYHRHTKKVTSEIDDYFNLLNVHLDYELRKIHQFKQITEALLYSKRKILEFIGDMFFYTEELTPTQLSEINKQLNKQTLISVWDMFNMISKSYEFYSHSSDYITNITTLSSKFKNEFNITLEGDQLQLELPVYDRITTDNNSN